jgi:NAD(P)-dependent dehydrogenase (short-subunit alcohol dehydrogenase family)
MKFRDHAVLITSASSGIGAALARELARDGPLDKTVANTGFGVVGA